MGKVKRSAAKFGHRVSRPGALDAQITKNDFAKPIIRKKGQKSKDHRGKKYVNVKKVFKESARQLRELAAEEPQDEEEEEAPKDVLMDSEDEDEAEEEGEDGEDSEECAEPENVDAIIKQFEKDMEVNLSEEERIFEALMPSSGERQQSFLAQVQQSLLERHTEIHSQLDELSECGEKQVDPAVRETCGMAGTVLQNYRSGPVPKMLKVMPKIRSWLELLYYTSPDKWSAAAMFQMTRVYCNQNAIIAQKFYEKVLLPRCRDDITHYKRLNYHLYRALAKALFKPAAFFKGIILPLCKAGDCTLREAVVFGSVVARKSIPMLHSAAAISSIARQPYSGANSIFLRVLFDKKYALPWVVVDEVCEHLVRFKHESRALPVLWHQALLTFVQRYKQDLSSDQKAQLHALTACRYHKIISKEVSQSFCTSTEDNSLYWKEHQTEAASAFTSGGRSGVAASAATPVLGSPSVPQSDSAWFVLAGVASNGGTGGTGVW